MSTYVLPQVQVFQDVSRTPTESIQPLRPLILGGNAVTFRYGVESERELGRLGYYDPVAATEYPWPNRPAGGVVDRPNVRVFVKNALLNYKNLAIDSGPSVVKSAGYLNRLRAPGFNFASAAGYDRDATLGDRDVKVGDVVKVRCVPLGGPAVTVWSQVTGLVGDPVASVRGAAESDSGNASTQGASASAAQTTGAINTLTASANGGSYEGRPSGHVSEVYTVVVLDGSVNGDLETARLRVLSASGTDDVPELTPNAAGVATPVGTRGLTVTWSVNHSGALSASAEAEDVPVEDFVTGQQWRVTVNQAFTAPAATSAGTYTGSRDTTYVVTVLRGGAWASSPLVKCATVDGTDASGPTAVTGASTAVAVGTAGVTVSFSGLGLRTGDRYYIPVTAATTGAVRTLVLANALPTAVPDDSRVGLELYALRDTAELPRNREGYAPLTNWSTAATSITLAPGAVVYDPDFTDGGVPVPLALQSNEGLGYGLAYADYRAWVPGSARAVGFAAPSDDLDSLVDGPTEPVNPLKYAVHVARLNSARSDATGDVSVGYLAVADPSSLDSWNDALDKLVGVSGVYGIVPLTADPAVVAAVRAHVAQQSTPEEGLWRACWVSLPALPEVPLVSAGSSVPGHLAATTSDGATCLCVIEDDPTTSGTQYTRVRCTSGNAKFITNGVAPGATVRSLYTTDGFGGTTYSEFVVDAVLSEDMLRLVAGPDAPQSVAAKTEVWMTLDAPGEADAVARIASAYNDSRTVAVWPDRYEYLGETLPGYYLCAALAGLTGALPPHQSATRIQVLGVDSVPRTVDRFNRTQLNRMAGSGVWVVTEDPVTGVVHNRHGVTTAPYDQIAFREEMRRRNRDSISYRFKAHFEPFIGVTNVVSTMQDRLLLETKTLIRVLQNTQFTTELGGQLVDATIVRLSPHDVMPDAFVLVLDIVEPNALNSFPIHLVV